MPDPPDRDAFDPFVGSGRAPVARDGVPGRPTTNSFGARSQVTGSDDLPVAAATVARPVSSIEDRRWSIARRTVTIGAVLLSVAAGVCVHIAIRSIRPQADSLVLTPALLLLALIFCLLTAVLAIIGLVAVVSGRPRWAAVPGLVLAVAGPAVAVVIGARTGARALLTLLGERLSDPTSPESIAIITQVLQHSGLNPLVVQLILALIGAQR